jgi:hypothetical protein
MRVISAIDERQVIRAILEHLGIWLVRSRKYMTRQSGNTPLPISKANYSMILSEPVLDLIGERPGIHLG